MVSNLDLDQLLDLFKHWEKIQTTKENLFVPLSIAIIPAVLVSWKDIPTQGVLVGGVASILIYTYHVLVMWRYRTLIENIYEKTEEYTGGVREITKFPKFLRLAWLRAYLFFVMLITWVILVYLRFSAG
jgi:hypothetical protein